MWDRRPLLILNAGRLYLPRQPTSQIADALDGVVSFESKQLSQGTYLDEGKTGLQEKPVFPPPPLVNVGDIDVRGAVVRHRRPRPTLPLANSSFLKEHVCKEHVCPPKGDQSYPMTAHPGCGFGSFNAQASSRRRSRRAPRRPRCPLQHCQTATRPWPRPRQRR